MVWYRSINLRSESFIYPATGVTHKNSAGWIPWKPTSSWKRLSGPTETVTDGFILRATKATSEVVMSQTTRRLKPKRCPPIWVDALGNNDACLDHRTHLSGEMWAHRAFKYSFVGYSKTTLMMGHHSWQIHPHHNMFITMISISLPTIYS